MADVFVRIKGDKTHLDQTLGASEKAVGKSAGSMMSAMKGLIATAASGAVAMFFKSAVQASVDFETSQRKLEATSKLTGIALEDLQNTAKTGTEQFKLSAPLANDMAVELGKLASKAGDVSKATPGMAAFLDLGAARGLSAAETLKAVQQSILGIDEGTDKLFGKNPSVLYKEYADSIGTTAGKLTDEQKAQALLNAALNDGLKVQGEYGKYLGTFGGALSSINIGWEKFKVAVGGAVLAGGDAQGMATGIAEILGRLAGWIEKNEDGFIIFKDAVIAAGKALFDVGKTIYDVVEPALGPLLKVLFVGLLSAVHSAALGVHVLAAAFKGMAGDTLQALGTLVEKGGSLLKIFGVNVVAEAGGSIKQFGQTLSDSAKKSITDATANFNKSMGDLLKGRRQGNAEAEKEEKRSQGTLTQTHRTGAGERTAIAEREQKERAALIQRANDLLLKSAKDITLATTETKEAWQEIDREAKEATDQIVLSADAQKRLGDFTDYTAQQQARAAAFAAATKREFNEQVDSAAAIARGAMDGAQAMGLMSAEAASALNSVLNMATAIAKFGVGSPEGIIAIVGGLANAIAGFGDSAAEQQRKMLLGKVSDGLTRVANELGNFNLGASGRQFKGVSDVFTSVFEHEDTQSGLARGGLGAVNTAIMAREEIKKQLAKKGISIADATEMLEQIAPGLGEFFSTRDAATVLALLPKIIDALKNTEFGQFGQDATSQLAALEQSFTTFDVTDPKEQLKGYAQFADKFSPMLAAALRSDNPIAALQEIFVGLQNGTIKPEEFGDLSAPQSLSLINTILGLLRADPTGEGGVLPEDLFGPKGSTGPNGLNIPDPSPSTFTRTGGGTAGSMADVLFGALALAPGAPDVVPSLGAAGGSALVQALSEGALGGTHIEGGVVINVTQQPDEDGEAFANRVADLVLRRAGDTYALQRTSMGLRA